MLSRYCCFFLPRSEHFHSRTTQYIALNSYSMHSHTCRMGIGVRMLAPSAACLRNTDHCGIPGSLSTILEDTPCTQLGGESLLLILSLSLAHRHPCKRWAALAEHPSKLPTHLCSTAAVSSWRAALCLTETHGGEGSPEVGMPSLPQNRRGGCTDHEVLCPVFQGLQDVGAEEEPRHAHGTSKQHYERQKGFFLSSTTSFPMFSNTVSCMDVHF